MGSRKITPLLLAASVMVSCYVGGFVNSQPAMAVTRVDELRDVSSSHWAYRAIKDLVEKYNVLEGYPNLTFRGNRNPTRYELAAALNATIQTLGREIARLGAEKADKEDLATVAKLQQEFATELRTLQARTDALEARAVKIEAKNEEQDNRLAVLQKLRVYGDVNFGGYADISGNPGDAFTDGISSVGRVRINADYTAVEDKGGSLVGPGTVHTRLVAAFGRVAPLDGDSSIFTGRFTGASQIAGDSSLFNEGIRPNDFINNVNGNPIIGVGTTATSTGMNLRANTYLDSAYYSQVFRGQLPFMPEDQSWRSAATLHVGLIPWRDIFFKHMYQGDENTQFQNTGFVVNPAILPNNIVPRVAAEFRQGLGRWASIASKNEVSFLDTSDAVNGIGFTTELGLDYNLGFLDEYFGTQGLFNVAGNVYAGYYLIHSNGGATNNLVNVTTTMADGTLVPGQIAITNTVGENAYGFYAGGAQEIYRGIGVWGNYALNDTGPISVLMNALQNGTGTNVIYNSSTFLGTSLIYGIRQAWEFGAEVPIRALPKLITFGKRQRDAIGAAYGWIYPNFSAGSPAVTGTAAPVANPATGASREKILEAYYRMQVTDNFALIPSVQLVFSRLGFEPNETEVMIGLRTNFTF